MPLNLKTHLSSFTSSCRLRYPALSSRLGHLFEYYHIVPPNVPSQSSSRVHHQAYQNMSDLTFTPDVTQTLPNSKTHPPSRSPRLELSSLPLNHHTQEPEAARTTDPPTLRACRLDYTFTNLKRQDKICVTLRHVVGDLVTTGKTRRG